MDWDLLKNAAKEEVTLLSEELKALALDLHDHPEVAWKEEHAAQKLCELLNAHDLPAVEHKRTKFDSHLLPRKISTF